MTGFSHCNEKITLILITCSPSDGGLFITPRLIPGGTIIGRLLCNDPCICTCQVHYRVLLVDLMKRRKSSSLVCGDSLFSNNEIYAYIAHTAMHLSNAFHMVNRMM